MARQSLGATPHASVGAPAGPDDTAAQFRRMLRGSLAPTLVVGALAVGAAAIAGAQQAGSATLGVLLVVVFFSLSLVVMQRTAHLEPTTVMAVVLASYTVKIVALGVVMIALRDAVWVSGPALALSIIVCTLVWLAFEMRAFTRLRVLVTAEHPASGTGDGAPSVTPPGEQP